VVATFDQKLADGNAMHSVTHTHMARDSAGRTMTEIAGNCLLGKDGRMHQIVRVDVHDPVARTNMIWWVGDDQRKVVSVSHLEESRPAATPRVLQPNTPTTSTAESAARLQTATARQEQEQRFQHEDLGMKDFHGVEARGSRTTQTIPAAQEGNQQPLAVVNETWLSGQLGLTMMLVHDDPRFGRTVAEYEEFDRGEPDPSLFAPPAGYTVRETAQGQLGGDGVLLPPAPAPAP
jgi:hypothetical protein